MHFNYGAWVGVAQAQKYTKQRGLVHTRCKERDVGSTFSSSLETSDDSIAMITSIKSANLLNSVRATADVVSA